MCEQEGSAASVQHGGQSLARWLQELGVESGGESRFVQEGFESLGQVVEAQVSMQWLHSQHSYHSPQVCLLDYPILPDTQVHLYSLAKRSTDDVCIVGSV